MQNEKQHQNHRGPEEEEREKGVERLCEQIIVGNFANLGKDTPSKSRKHRGPHQIQQKLTLSKAYHIQTHKVLRQRESSRQQGKQVPKLQEKTDQVCSRPIQRNLAGLKGVVGYVQSAELETSTVKNSLCSKAIIQNRNRGKRFPDTQNLKEFVTAKSHLHAILRGDTQREIDIYLSIYLTIYLSIYLSL